MRRAAVLSWTVAWLLVSLVTPCAMAEPVPAVDAGICLSAVVALVEARFEGLMSSMQVLALTQEVRGRDWGNIEGLLTKLSQTSIPLLAWFARPDGSYFAVGTGLAAGNLSDRPYFPLVMAGEMTVGDLVVSKATGVKSIVATVPVWEAGRIVGALGVSVFAAELSRIIAEAIGLPEELVFYAVNGDGQIALHSNPDLIMQEASKLPSLDWEATRISRLLGWTFVLGQRK